MITKKTTCFALSIATTLTVNAAQTEYSSDTASITQYSAPEWYQDAKLGLWVHWGIYSVPAFKSEWYGRTMYNSPKNGSYKHHVQNYGDPGEFGYKDFIPMWKAEKWDPESWADLFDKAGAKFFTMMGMHHDSFSLYDSDLTKWDAIDMGPKRNLCKEIAAAVRKRGMKFGVSNHMGWNFQFFQFNHSNNFDAKAPATHDLYSEGKVDEKYIKRWWDRTQELADKFQPVLYFFDWGWTRHEGFDGKRKEFVYWYYNRAIQWKKGTIGDPGVVVCYKKKALPEGSVVLDLERGGLDVIRPMTWQNDTSIGKKSWSYIKDEKYKTTRELIGCLADVVSKNGVLMLNIGPKANGTIPEEVETTLLEMGQWLETYGEAIYATRPYEVFGEGPTYQSTVL